MASKLLGITKSILFIDPNVEDYQNLVGGTNPNIKIAILDTYRDGIQQITETLVRNQGVKAVHILSHGTSGCLYLGNSQLNLETLENYTEQLQQWRQILDDNADILIYGCNVAADLVFVQKLQELTGTNIAASATPTGNRRLGGDWNLEVSFGKVSTPIAFSAEVCQAYSGILAQINVGITDDNVDGDTSSINALLSDPGTDGEISLREAIIAANNTAGDDTINLIGGETYTLTITGSEEDDSETGDLDIKDNGEIVVQTLGNVTATIDAGGISGLDDRVFEVQSNASLKLDKLNITGGVASGSSPHGGAILVNSNANLELTQSILTGNEASSGGAIFNDAGAIAIDKATISGNTVSFLPSRGGAIVNSQGIVTITQTTISANSANSAGGSIFNAYGTLDIDNSTISNNTASSGGGIFNIEGTANITNSTISSNSVGATGSAIHSQWNSLVNIDSSTITRNHTDINDFTAVYSYDSTFNMANTIVAGNIDNKDISGDPLDFNSGGNNLIGNSNAGLGFTNGVNGDIVGTAASPIDPQLGPLQNNGGPTETHALLANSPAIDAGNTNENNDQRGASRDSNPDIGAFEFGGIPIMTQESNDTLLRAISTGLTINNDGTFSYSGEIGDNPNVYPERDVDFFKVDLGIGDRLRLPEIIDLLDENDNDIGDAAVQLFDSTGTFISPSLFNSPDPGYVIYEANQAGTFYIGISGQGNTSYNPDQEGSGSAGTPGKYDLTIETIGRQMGGNQNKLYFSRDTSFNDDGLYILDTTTGNPIPVGTNGNTVANVGLAPSNTSSFLYGSEPETLLKINADGSVANSIGSGNFFDTKGLAYDPTNNILYGIDDTNFYTVNQNTGNSISQLAAPPVSLQGLTFGNAGVYGVGNSQDLLFYDPNTDQWSVIGDTGISSWQEAGLAFDAEKNVLYAKRFNDTLLYEIDVSTAQATSIGDTGFLEGGGLALVSDDAYEEPNDTIQRATNTGLTQQNHGTFSYFGEIGDNTNVLPEDDVDFFKFDLGLGERVRIPRNIELLDENGNFTPANAEVQLFDETGQPFPTTLDFVFTDTDNNDIYEARESGTFYLGISGNGNTNYFPDQEGSGSGNEAGSYGLTIETIGREMGGTGTITSQLYFSSDSSSGDLYILNTTRGNATRVSTNPNLTGMRGLAPSESSGFLYSSNNNYGLSKINANGTVANQIGNNNYDGLAYDASRNILYGTDGGSLYSINPNTGEEISLNSSNGSQALAFGNGGVYGLGSGQDLMFYDPNTNNWSTIGNTGISSWNNAGLAFDTEKNVLYAKRDGDTLLYEIDASTAQTQSIGDTGVVYGGGLALVENVSRGKLYFTSDFSGDSFYSLNTTTGNATRVSTNPNFIGMRGLAPSDSSSFLYGGSNELFKINADGSVANQIGNNFINYDGLAYDASRDILYGTNGSSFYSINPNTGEEISNLASPFTSLQGLAFGNGGVYGLGSNQDLMFYDPNTDNWSTIGDTGISSWNNVGLAFDTEKNVLYAKRDGDTLLYEIDVSTAELTVIGDTGIQYGGGLAFVNEDFFEEVNDTRERATQTGLTQNNHGIFSYVGEIGDNINLRREDDVDLFEIHLDLGEMVRLPDRVEIIYEEGYSSGDAELQLFDATGNTLSLLPESPGYNYFAVTQESQAGTFYVGISGTGNINYNLDTEGSGSGSVAGSYGITIETIGREMGKIEGDPRLFAFKDDGF